MKRPSASRPNVVEGLPIKFEDIAEPVTNDKGDVTGYNFQKTKAVNALCSKISLVMTPGSDKIWRFDGQVFLDSGQAYIKNLLYTVAGDVVDKVVINEVLDRISSRLQLSPQTFNPSPHLLGVQNGVIDCRTGKFRPYNKQDLITDQLPVIYDEKARCPEIIKFLESITPSHDDRLTLIEIIASGAYRKALAYLAFLIGHGSSGSSTFIHLLQAFYGAENTEAIPLNELVERPFALSSLKNVRYSIGQEIEDVKKSGTARIKEISGGDWISADVKNKDRTRFQGWTKLIFKGNAVPRFADTTWAFRRRFVEVKLPYKFVPEIGPDETDETNQRLADPDIEEKITTPAELSGLLNLIMARLPRIIENKRIYRAEGQYEAYKQQVDSVTSFLDTFCTYYPEAVTVRIPVKDIYGHFEKWCGLVMGNEVDVRQFGRYVKHYCANRPGLETTIEGRTVTVYQGLTFDQERFEQVTRDLQTGLRPDRTGSDTGIKKGQQIPITGYTGLESNVYAIWKDVMASFGPLYRKECENGKNDPFFPVFDSSQPCDDPFSDPVKPDIDPVKEFLADGGQASQQRFLVEFPEAADI